MFRSQLLMPNARAQRFDPAGFILEHYVDGDLLDMSEPIHKNPASPDNLHVWGESRRFNMRA